MSLSRPRALSPPRCKVSKLFARDAHLIASDALPGYRSFIQDGAYGETFKDNSTNACAKAMRRELERWKTGRRDPKMIADRWRSQCSLDVVISRLVALAEGHPSR